jgi:fatty-acyl-CoA synthase
MVAEHASAGDGPLTQPVAVSAGGAPPSPTLLGRLEALNMSVTHLYGLTETFGPVMVNQWQPEWDALDEQARATLKARQGVPNVLASSARVVDVDGRDIEPDGQSVGELVIRGNNLMLGYYRDDVATAAASLDGWFRTGDLAALHPDGYVEIRDRLKDVIISGGENIASVEIEQVLDSHPAIVESAVVGMPDERWGEVPVAFVTTRVGVTLTEAEVIEFVRERLARFKAPKRVEFLRLPRTSTGKIQKNLLRATVQDGAGHADA